MQVRRWPRPTCNMILYIRNRLIPMDSRSSDGQLLHMSVRGALILCNGLLGLHDWTFRGCDNIGLLSKQNRHKLKKRSFWIRAEFSGHGFNGHRRPRYGNLHAKIEIMAWPKSVTVVNRTLISSLVRANGQSGRYFWLQKCTLKMERKQCLQNTISFRTVHFAPGVPLERVTWDRPLSNRHNLPAAKSAKNNFIFW